LLASLVQSNLSTKPVCLTFFLFMVKRGRVLELIFFKYNDVSNFSLKKLI
jgi:hypothetical protein